LPNIASIAFPETRTDLLLTLLDSKGLCVSGGSACTSGAALPSHVLSAMGYPDDIARAALRCSLGRYTTHQDVHMATDAITQAVTQLRRQSTHARVLENARQGV
jgi:cysteine desulfurase